MSANGLEVIDHTVHTTHAWINELAERLDWASKRSTLHLLRATLHHVRDHLLINELAHFSAQLPLLVRGMLFEGWMPKSNPTKVRSPQEFVASIGAEMDQAQEFRGAEDIRCVFDLLNARLSAGEIEDIRSSFSSGIRGLWPAP